MCITRAAVTANFGPQRLSLGRAQAPVTAHSNSPLTRITAATVPTFSWPPSYVPGPNFPAIGPAPLPGIQRNSLNAPGYNDVDLSLSKAFGLPRIPGLGETAQFLVRVDVYNFFNKTNINAQSIDANLGSVAPDGTVTPNSELRRGRQRIGQ